MAQKTSLEATKIMRIGVVVPHIFMQDELLSQVIFSPGDLAIRLCNGLVELGHSVTLYSPGPVDTAAANVTSDSSLFDNELRGRGDTPIDLLKKHPFTFVTLARQLQSELIARAYKDANDGLIDLVHVYTNEEELAMSFASLCQKPILFTHHDPFNFLIKYKNNFPKYSHLNWISISHAQRSSMPPETNWTANIYHGFTDEEFAPVENPANDYLLFLGRIIQPKGLHLAVQAVQQYNLSHPDTPIKLKIAGKHYADDSNDSYWKEFIEPALEDQYIEHVGFIGDKTKKAALLANARALVVPSIFDEPFGMVGIEALACGTPVIGLDSGAIPEVVTHQKSGFIAKKIYSSDNRLDELQTVDNISAGIGSIDNISRADCRSAYLERFTSSRMCQEHAEAYAGFIQSQDQS